MSSRAGPRMMLEDDSCNVSNWMFLGRFLCYLLLFCFLMSFFANLTAMSEKSNCGCRKKQYRYVEEMNNIPYADVNENIIQLSHFASIDLNAPQNTDTLLTGMAHIYDDKITINAFLPIIDGAVFHPLKGGQVTYKAYASASEKSDASSFRFLGDLQKDGDKVYKLTSKFDKMLTRMIVVTKNDVTSGNEQILLVGRV